MFGDSSQQLCIIDRFVTGTQNSNLRKETHHESSSDGCSSSTWHGEAPCGIWTAPLVRSLSLRCQKETAVQDSRNYCRRGGLAAPEKEKTATDSTKIIVATTSQKIEDDDNNASHFTLSDGIEMPIYEVCLGCQQLQLVLGTLADFAPWVVLGEELQEPFT
jgi:hypothetical protein